MFVSDVIMSPILVYPVVTNVQYTCSANNLLSDALTSQHLTYNRSGSYPCLNVVTDRSRVNLGLPTEHFDRWRPLSSSSGSLHIYL